MFFVLSSAHCGVEDDSEEMSSGCSVGDVCRERETKKKKAAVRELGLGAAYRVPPLLRPTALVNLSQETTETDI